MPSPREIWHWQEAGTAWKGVGIYLHQEDIRRIGGIRLYLLNYNIFEVKSYDHTITK
jgi:hypothetical protein